MNDWKGWGSFFIKDEGDWRQVDANHLERVIPGQVSDEYLLPECADEEDEVSRALELMATSGYDLLHELGYTGTWQ